MTQERTERRHTEQKKRKATRKFMDGKITPQDYHRQHGFPKGAKCAGCGGPPAVKAMVFAEVKEAVKRGMMPPPMENGVINEAVVKTLVKFKGPSGPVLHARLSQSYSCTSCRVDFEKALARAPSWCVVEINEGPDPRNRVSVGYAS